MFRFSHTTSLFTLFLLLNAAISHSQSYLVDNPYIVNYSKTFYKGGTENWDVETTSDGNIYFANNDGLLHFNGYDWKIYKLPNKTIVRSIALDTARQLIYVGGQDELGYFQPDKTGSLEYHNIKLYLPSTFQSIEDVWDIQLLDGHMYFRSVNKIFDYFDKTITVIPTTSKTITFLHCANGSLYYGSPEAGLHQIKDGADVFITGSDVFRNDRISDIVPLSNKKLLVISEKSGIFSLDDDIIKPFLQDTGLKNSILATGVLINDNLIAIGTVLNGIVFLDNQGKRLFSFKKNQGLQNNSIICMSLDGNGNLWTGTTNGIDHILINAAYTIMYPDGEQQGGAYAVKIFNNTLYVGTNNGLFYAPWPKKLDELRTVPFKKVSNTEGQVWGLDIVNGDLFMGHNNGAFQIVNNTAIKLSTEQNGTWRYIARGSSNDMIVGTYSGFDLYSKQNGSWTFVKKIDGFKESARILALDAMNQLWVSHPYRGVYKLHLADDNKSFTSILNYGAKNGLPSDLGNYVTNLNDGIYVNGTVGIFKYDEATDQFLPDSEMSNLLGKNTTTLRLFQGEGKNIWYVNENESGVILVEDNALSKNLNNRSTPFLQNKQIGGFENIYVYNNDQVFVCTDKGLILVDINKLQHEQSLKVRFNTLVNGGLETNTIFAGHQNEPATITSFSNIQNNISVNLGSNRLDATDMVQYSFYLEGLDKDWGAWTFDNTKEYSNLPPKSYTLKAKCRDSQGNESQELVYSFKILPPWYASIFAKFIYLIALILLFFYFFKKVNTKHETEKSKLIQDKEISEAKVEELLNEKLQSEINFKNKELALSTMHIVQKNETLTKLREELDNIVQNSKDVDTKKQIKKVTSILSDDQRLEDDWDSFAFHFDQVHTDFLRRLKEKYPQLSPKDMKLCAYLRMNMTTKDIAPLLNISVRGVEISRYRLRKKMELDPEINLNDFMMQY